MALRTAGVTSVGSDTGVDAAGVDADAALASAMAARRSDEQALAANKTKTSVQKSFNMMKGCAMSRVDEWQRC